MFFWNNKKKNTDSRHNVMEVVDVNTCGTCSILAALPNRALSALDICKTKILEIREHMKPVPLL